MAVTLPRRRAGARRFNADLGRLRVQLHIPLARGPVPLAEAHEGIVPRRDFQFKGTVPQARVLEVERSRLNGGRLAEYFIENNQRLIIAVDGDDNGADPGFGVRKFESDLLRRRDPPGIGRHGDFRPVKVVQKEINAKT